jgi:hypothetical protein
MIKGIALALLLVATSNASASPIDGQWKVVWSCDGVTGVYAERCANGERDFFWLELRTAGPSICGFHIATGQMGSKVDEGDLLDGAPTIVGSLNGNAAQVSFRAVRGATGVASIRVTGEKLEWKILKQSEDSWFPKNAVLTKQPAGETPPKCDPHLPVLGKK